MKTLTLTMLIGAIGITSLGAFASDMPQGPDGRPPRSGIMGTGMQLPPPGTGSGMMMHPRMGSGSELREGIKQERSQMQAKLEENRAQMEKNGTEFYQEFGTASGAFANISKVNQVKLKNLHKQLKTDLDALGEEYKTKIQNASSLDERTTLEKEFFDKIVVLETTFYHSALEIVASDESATAWLEARQGLFTQNQALRQENRTARQNFRQDRSEKVKQYKTTLYTKVGTQVTKIAQKNPEKLDKLLLKVNTLKEKYKANTQLSEDAKNSILDQLDALEEIIQETIDSNK